MECTARGNDFELILMAKMETRHPSEGSFGSEFPSVCNHCGVMAVWIRKTLKFGRPEIGKVVRYLPDQKKQQNFVWLFSSRYCADRAQNLPRPAPDNVLTVLQISSKSVHFRRSYIRTREHHQSALESEFNIRLKPSFEPNNYRLTYAN